MEQGSNLYEINVYVDEKGESSQTFMNSSNTQKIGITNEANPLEFNSSDNLKTKSRFPAINNRNLTNEDNMTYCE